MAQRVFRDQEQRQWMVWDVRPTQFGDGRARAFVHAELENGWLCFESSTGRRRLAPIPSEWVELDDYALQKLLSASIPVRGPNGDA